MALEQKFCVTATVVSKFSTAWCHPPGTNTVSPASCVNSSIRGDDDDEDEDDEEEDEDEEEDDEEKEEEG